MESFDPTHLRSVNMQAKEHISLPCFIASGFHPRVSRVIHRCPHRHVCQPTNSLTTSLRMSTSTSSVVLCPGQGAQAEKMGLRWAEASSAAAAIIEKADRVYGNAFGSSTAGERKWRLSELLREGERALLDRTDIAQPAIYVVSMACWEGLKELGIARFAEVVAGLSLGEYTALTIAGALEFEDGLELVRLRGKAMQKAAEMSEGGMVALIGANEEKAGKCVEACARKDQVLVAANFNAPGQVVLSGSKEATQRAADYAKSEFKLRVAPLDVAGAFHSPLMAPAAAQLASVLAKTKISPPKVPVLSNVTARPHTAEDIRTKLVEQLVSPVLWASCMDYIREDSVSDGSEKRWLELAPGKTLTGIMRKIDRTVKVENFDVPVPAMQGAAKR